MRSHPDQTATGSLSGAQLQGSWRQEEAHPRGVPGLQTHRIGTIASTTLRRGAAAFTGEDAAKCSPGSASASEAVALGATF